MPLQSSPTRAPSQSSSYRRPPLGYQFDPIPKAAVDLCHSGGLLRQDLDTLATLLRLARRVRTSCWTTRRHLATTMGISEATVKRSLRRLQQAGLIRHVPVDVPDPDEPRNRTGWRFVFCWMEKGVAGTNNTLSGDQKGAGKFVNTLSGGDRGVDTRDNDPTPSVTPTPGPARPLPRVGGDPQIERERSPSPPGSDGMNNHGVVVGFCRMEKAVGQLANTFSPGDRGVVQLDNAPKPSATTAPEEDTRIALEPPSATTPVDRTSPAEGRSCGATDADIPAITARALERFREATEADVAKAVADHGVERVAVAVMGLKRLESFRGVVGACRVWAGGSAPTDAEVKAARESLEARRPRSYHRAPVRTEAEVAETRAAGTWLKEWLRANG